MKRLLPPVLFFLLAVLMGFVCWGLGSSHYIAYPFNLAGLLLVAGGIGMAMYHSALFRRRGANIMTFDEPTRFVTEGLYEYTRNPMYLGLVVALFGVAVLYQGGLTSFALAIFFLVVTDRWYIQYEEREMLGKFGADYAQYRKDTPRWL